MRRQTSPGQRRAGVNWPRCSIRTPPVPGETQTPLRPEIASIAVSAALRGRNMEGEDFAVTAGWGHLGTGDAVLPGQGRAIERALSFDERTATGYAIPVLRGTTFDK